MANYDSCGSCCACGKAAGSQAANEEDEEDEEEELGGHGGGRLLWDLLQVEEASHREACPCEE